MNYLHITDSCDVYRLVRVGDKESYGNSPILAGIKCQIMPASSDILAVYPGEPSYQLYEIFTYAMDPIKNGDKLKSGLTEYIVRGVARTVNTSLLKYQQLVGEKVV